MPSTVHNRSARIGRARDGPDRQQRTKPLDEPAPWSLPLAERVLMGAVYYRTSAVAARLRSRITFNRPENCVTRSPVNVSPPHLRSALNTPALQGRCPVHTLVQHPLALW